jgi:hypothetical protein
MVIASTPTLCDEVPPGQGVVEKLEIISGWKDIATYLKKGVRTVQRYERELGLPVRRPAGKSHGSVIATKSELDGWIIASPIRETFRLPAVSVEHAKSLSEFRCHVKELHRLREETAELHAAVTASMELLQETLHSVLPQQNQTRLDASGYRQLADVLAFRPTKKAI